MALTAIKYPRLLAQWALFVEKKLVLCKYSAGLAWNHSPLPAPRNSELCSQSHPWADGANHSDFMIFAHYVSRTIDMSTKRFMRASAVAGLIIVASQ